MNQGLQRLMEVPVTLSHCPLTHILADFLPHSRPKATSGEEKGNGEGTESPCSTSGRERPRGRPQLPSCGAVPSEAQDF